MKEITNNKLKELISIVGIDSVNIEDAKTWVRENIHVHIASLPVGEGKWCSTILSINEKVAVGTCNYSLVGKYDSYEEALEEGLIKVFEDVTTN